MIEVHHDASARRFSADVEGRQAVLDYTICGDVMTITHTGVPDEIGGRGIAGELVRAALAPLGMQDGRLFRFARMRPPIWPGI